jgi:NADH:ubiquinone oxidoreductase subunit 2 (subunit N)
MMQQAMLYPFAAPGAAFASGVTALLLSSRRKSGGLLAAFILAALAPAAALWSAAHFHTAGGAAWFFGQRNACLDILVCSLPLVCLMPMSAGGQPLPSCGFMLLACAGTCALSRGVAPVFVFASEAVSICALAALFACEGKSAPARWMLAATAALACAAYGIALMTAHASGTLHAAGAVLFCAPGMFMAGIFPFNAALADIFADAGAAHCAFYAAAVLPASALALLRFADALPPNEGVPLKTALAGLGALSALLASLAALRERNLGRITGLMAAASACWIICPAAVPGGVMPAMSCAVAQAFSFAGLCAVLSCVKTPDAEEPLSGLENASPAAAFALLAALASYAGLPFTAGFTSKFHVMSALISHGPQSRLLCAALAAVMLLNTALALRIIKPAFFGEVRGEGERFSFSPTAYLVMLLCCGAIIGLGIMPQILFELAQLAAH